MTMRPSSSTLRTIPVDFIFVIPPLYRRRFSYGCRQRGSPGLAITKDDITFRWFAATLSPDAIQAYVHFALAVNKMSLALKYSSPIELQILNEKYQFRCWLLRLGFIGETYKSSRKVFLDKLSGDGAFRTGKSKKIINSSAAV